MITATAQQFITGALQDLGILPLGQSPGGTESEDALVLLNLMADALGVDRLLLYQLVRTTKTLASGTANYTIGPGGDIDLVRPLWITRAGLIQDTAAATPSEVPIAVLDDDEYAEWPQKTLQAPHARALFYDHGFSATDRGTVYPLPIPNVATTQLVLYTPGGEVSQFADLVTSYTFPTGWGMAIRSNFALRLSAMYPQAIISAELRASARGTKALIRAANVRPIKRRNTPLLTGRGAFDIDSGTCR